MDITSQSNITKGLSSLYGRDAEIGSEYISYGGRLVEITGFDEKELYVRILRCDPDADPLEYCSAIGANRKIGFDELMYGPINGKVIAKIIEDKTNPGFMEKIVTELKKYPTEKWEEIYDSMTKQTKKEETRKRGFWAMLFGN